jgi:hypothetical protein
MGEVFLNATHILMWLGSDLSDRRLKESFNFPESTSKSILNSSCDPKIPIDYDKLFEAQVRETMLAFRDITAFPFFDLL